MKPKFLFLSLLSYSTLFLAQNQKYTLSEAVNGLRSNLAMESVSQFSFSSDSKGYYSLKEGAYLYKELGGAKKDTLLSLYRLNQALGANDRLEKLPNITFQTDSRAYFTKEGSIVLLEKSAGKWRRTATLNLPKGAANINVLSKKNAAVYTLEQNLYYIDQAGIKEISISENENIISGQAVHRNEFGIDRGIFISPSQDAVAFYKMDQTMVKDYPVIDWSESPAQNVNIKYPMAGAVSHQVILGVYDLKSGKTTWINTQGDKEQYLTAVTWSPDSKSIFIGLLNRDQNDLYLNQYSTVTGEKIKEVLHESSSTYVEPQHPLTFFPGSTSDFIWQSERSGYNHLYHYNLEKGLIGALTKGAYTVTELLGFNEKKKEVFYTSTEVSPLERHHYKVNWNNFKKTQLSSESGMHQGRLSSDGNYLYDAYSSGTTPRVVEVLSTHSPAKEVLLKSKDPLASYQRPEIQNVTLKAEDGTPLYGKLILPTDFDKTKKYPVIVYLYGGPHLQLITNSYPNSGNLWYEYMAQRGYVVFTMDNRGSSGRGAKFERATFRNLGENEMKDQLKGVEYLKSLPFVDAQRMGVHGWSFGGFMTTNLMLSYPEVFKVGVAGGPVIDWNWYEIMYTERYMDSPEQNPEGYKKAKLTDKVANLKGKLLMIHGAQDDVVVWQHSIKFLKAAVDEGVQLDYFVYPGHAHNVLGKDRVHLMQKVTDYFDLYLQEPKK